MTETFTFELVTPEKLLLSKPVAMVTVPGGEGDYGVLAGHAPMITNVKAGVISVYADNENTVSERIFVAGGFADVTPAACTVLAEEAVAVSAIDRAQVEEQLKALQGSAAQAATDAERERVEAKIAVAEAKLQALAA